MGLVAVQSTPKPPRNVVLSYGCHAGLYRSVAIAEAEEKAYSSPSLCRTKSSPSFLGFVIARNTLGESALIQRKKEGAHCGPKEEPQKKVPTTRVSLCLGV